MIFDLACIVLFVFAFAAGFITRGLLEGRGG